MEQTTREKKESKQRLNLLCRYKMSPALLVLWRLCMIYTIVASKDGKDSEGRSELQETEKNVWIDLSSTIDNYNEVKKDTFKFNDKIAYDRIALKGALEGTGGTSKKEKQKTRCLQLIDAFGNLKAKELILNKIYTEKSLLKKTILQGKNILHKQTLEVDTIVFKDVSYDFVIEVLERYSFKPAPVVIIEINEKICLNMIESIPISNTYKKIKVGSINYYNKKPLKKTTIQRLLPVLYEKEEIPFSFEKLSWSKESINMKEILSNVKSCTIHEHEGIFRLQGAEYKPKKRNELEIVAESSCDFSNNLSWNDKHHSLSLDLTTSHDILEKEWKKIAPNLESASREFTDTPAEFPFKVDIKFKESTPLTIELLTEVLQWAAVYTKHATKLRICNLLLTREDSEKIRQLCIEIEEMPHLEYLSLEEIGPEKVNNIVLKDVAFRKNIMSSVVEPFLEDKATIILRLSMYMHRYVQYIKNNEEVTKDIYLPFNSSATLTICSRCNLQIFIEKAPEDLRNNSKDIICLEKIKNMTYEEFCTDLAHERINTALRTFLADGLVVTKQNFRKLVERFLRKGIIRLKCCGITSCVDCLSQKTFADDYLNEYRVKKENIQFKCEQAGCKSRFGISPNFYYAFNLYNTTYIENKYIVNSATKHNGLYIPLWNIKYAFLPLRTVEPRRYDASISSTFKRPNFIVNRQNKQEKIKAEEGFSQNPEKLSFANMSALMNVD